MNHTPLTDRLHTLLKDAGFEQAKMGDTPMSLGMDSLDRVEFGMLVEKEFNIAIPDKDLFTYQRRTFGEWALYIEKTDYKRV